MDYINLDIIIHIVIAIVIASLLPDILGIIILILGIPIVFISCILREIFCCIIDGVDYIKKKFRKY